MVCPFLCGSSNVRYCLRIVVISEQLWRFQLSTLQANCACTVCIALLSAIDRAPGLKVHSSVSVRRVLIVSHICDRCSHRKVTGSIPRHLTHERSTLRVCDAQEWTCQPLNYPSIKEHDQNIATGESGDFPTQFSGYTISSSIARTACKSYSSTTRRKAISSPGK